MPRVLINIDVPDLASAETFYTKSFGLTVGRRFGADGVELLGCEAPLYLLRKDKDALPFRGARHLRTYERHWAPIHLDIGVEDIQAAVRRVISAQVLWWKVM